MTVSRERWQVAKARALRTLHGDETRWPTAWRRQRAIAEGLLDEKQRRTLSDIRARRFAKELDELFRRG